MFIKQHLRWKSAAVLFGSCWLDSIQAIWTPKTMKAMDLIRRLLWWLMSKNNTLFYHRWPLMMANHWKRIWPPSTFSYPQTKRMFAGRKRLLFILNNKFRSVRSADKNFAYMRQLLKTNIKSTSIYYIYTYIY